MFKSVSNPKFKRTLVFILVSLVFTTISCTFPTLRFPFLNTDVQLNEVRICEKEISQNTKDEGEIDRYCGDFFSVENYELNICGELSGVKDIDVFLNIVLYKDEILRPVFHNTVDDRFSNGFFCRSIELPAKEKREGDYVIEIHHNRDTLTSTEFEIR